MSRFARARDANEPEIVDALRAAGASVSRLDGPGLPDLLVGYQGETFLVEVKMPLIGDLAPHRYQPGAGGSADLTDPQVAWWGAWRGRGAVIVRSAAEALAVLELGATGKLERLAGVCACGSAILRGERGPAPERCRACRRTHELAEKRENNRLRRAAATASHIGSGSQSMARR